MQRILWFDALRASLAIGIVLCHTHNVFDDFSFVIGEPISPLLARFRVPCFHFLAGLLSIRALETYTGRYLAQRTRLLFNRFVVPSVFFLLFAVPFDDFVDAVSSGCVRGNYFLVALFEISVFNTFLLCIANKHRESVSPKNVLILSAALTTLIISLFHDKCFDYLHWKQATFGNMFFASGMICGMHKSSFFKLLSRKYLVLVAGVLLVACYAVADMPHASYFVRKTALKIITPFVAIYLIFALFHSIKHIFRNDAFIGKISLYLGQRTLATYTISWVLIPILAAVRPQFIILDDDSYFWFAFLIAYIGSLIIHDVLCQLPYVEKYIFGRPKPLRSFYSTVVKTQNSYVVEANTFKEANPS